jgi:hypothetical protein
MTFNCKDEGGRMKDDLQGFAPRMKAEDTCLTSFQVILHPSSF